MPTPTTMQAATLLERHIRENRLGKKKRIVAKEMGVTYGILYGFLKGKNTHPDNIDAILNWMKDKRIISRLGPPRRRTPRSGD